MSFSKWLGTLFGGGEGDNNGAAAHMEGETSEYEGCRITPLGRKEGGQWQLAARIVKDFEEGPREHLLLRADFFASREEAETFALRKAHQVIDQIGDRLFDQPSLH